MPSCCGHCPPAAGRGQAPAQRPPAGFPAPGRGPAPIQRPPAAPGRGPAPIQRPPAGYPLAIPGRPMSRLGEQQMRNVPPPTQMVPAIRGPPPQQGRQLQRPCGPPMGQNMYRPPQMPPQKLPSVMQAMRKLETRDVLNTAMIEGNIPSVPRNYRQMPDVLNTAMIEENIPTASRSCRQMSDVLNTAMIEEPSTSEDESTEESESGPDGGCVCSDQGPCRSSGTSATSCACSDQGPCKKQEPDAGQPCACEKDAPCQKKELTAEDIAEMSKAESQLIVYDPEELNRTTAPRFDDEEIEMINVFRSIECHLQGMEEEEAKTIEKFMKEVHQLRRTAAT